MRVWLASILSVVVAASGGCGDDGGSTPHDGGSPDTPSQQCAAPTGGPTTHSGTISADETWSAAGSPHVLTSNVTIAAGATVTVEPCAELRLAPAMSLLVDGTLHARGAAGQRITMHQDVAGQRFGTLTVNAPGYADLAYVDISGGGGGNPSYGGTVLVTGKDFPPAKPLRVEKVTISDSAGLGLALWHWAAFADGSSGLTIRGAGADLPDYPYPLRVSLNTLSSIPTGDYTGNAVDAIQVVGEAPHWTVEKDDTVHARGVPYRIGGHGDLGDIRIDGGDKLATLTIEPGVTLEHTSTAANIGRLEVGVTGPTSPTARIIAVGTADKPIVFSGVGPAGVAAGAWAGITFKGPLAPDNRLEHVRIDAAGAHDGARGFGCLPGGALDTDGAVKLFSEPSKAFLLNSTISRSSSNGVFRAWTGSQVDFMATNTFEDVAGCKQVLPKPPTGSCPTDPPCP